MTFPNEAPADRDLRRLRTLYRALGDETRLRIIGLLAENGPLPVNELSARVGLSQPLISWHLRILRLAGVITDILRSICGNCFAATTLTSRRPC